MEMNQTEAIDQNIKELMSKLLSLRVEDKNNTLNIIPLTLTEGEILIDHKNGTIHLSSTIKF